MCIRSVSYSVLKAKENKCLTNLILAHALTWVCRSHPPHAHAHTQGDRMWQFLVTLLLATLYPGSLLLPGVFGLVLGLLVALFGTMIGDCVDRNRRMKGS